MASLTSDERFIRTLFDGLCVGPPSSFGDLACGAAGDSSSSGGGSGGADSKVTPAPPADEPRYVQLWGLLRELCTLVTLSHPISRTRTYKTLAAAGLLQAIGLAIDAEYPGGAPLASAASGPGSGAGSSSRDFAVTAQVRALDVLLCLLNHDPSIFRNACTAQVGDEAGGAWGGGRKEARGLVSALIRMLGEGTDEGLLVQASEAVRILMEPFSMEPSEQNAFLDFIYGTGQMSCLLASLRRRAAETLPSGAPGGASPAHDGLMRVYAEAAGVTVSGSPGAEGAGFAGPRVSRIEAMLDVLGASLGAHGYRSQRLASDENLWEALADLLSQPRGSLRACATRLLRALVCVHPACADKVAEYGLIAKCFAQLRTRPWHDGAPRDSLANSTVLALLQSIHEVEALGGLRAHLISVHAAELHEFAAQNVLPVRALLQSANVEMAEAQALAADEAAAAASTAGGGGGGAGTATGGAGERGRGIEQQSPEGGRANGTRSPSPPPSAPSPSHRIRAPPGSASSASSPGSSSSSSGVSSPGTPASAPSPASGGGGFGHSPSPGGASSHASSRHRPGFASPPRPSPEPLPSPPSLGAAGLASPTPPSRHAGGARRAWWRREPRSESAASRQLPAPRFSRQGAAAAAARSARWCSGRWRRRRRSAWRRAATHASRMMRERYVPRLADGRALAWRRRRPPHLGGNARLCQQAFRHGALRAHGWPRVLWQVVRERDARDSGGHKLQDEEISGNETCACRPCCMLLAAW